MILALANSPVSAQALEDRLEQARLAARAQAAVVEDEALRAYTITVDLRDGTIRLRGRVATDRERNRAETIAQGVWGRAVDNQIVVEAVARRRTGTIPPPLRGQFASGEVTPAEAPVRSPDPAPAAVREQHHTVRSGDTLFGIARQHGTSVEELQRLNNLRGTNLRPGQRLRVR